MEKGFQGAGAEAQQQPGDFKQPMMILFDPCRGRF
jgi:hypothetical protein